MNCILNKHSFSIKIPCKQYYTEKAITDFTAVFMEEELILSNTSNYSTPVTAPLSVGALPAPDCRCMEIGSSSGLPLPGVCQVP